MKRTLTPLTALAALTLRGCASPDPATQACDLLLHPADANIRPEQLGETLEKWGEATQKTDPTLSGLLLEMGATFPKQGATDPATFDPTTLNQLAETAAQRCEQLGYE